MTPLTRNLELKKAQEAATSRASKKTKLLDYLNKKIAKFKRFIEPDKNVINIHLEKLYLGIDKNQGGMQ